MFLCLLLPLLAHAEGPRYQSYYQCIHVVDGDTLVVKHGTERPLRVRLIGVDTPETVRPETPVEYFGREASAFTKRMVQGKEVRLEFDEQRYDKYNRLLAFVYLPDGTMLNEEIIRQGYGHVFRKFPFKYRKEFYRLEREARKEHRGLWKDSTRGNRRRSSAKIKAEDRAEPRSSPGAP